MNLIMTAKRWTFLHKYLHISTNKAETWSNCCKENWESVLAEKSGGEALVTRSQLRTSRWLCPVYLLLLLERLSRSWIIAHTNTAHTQLVATAGKSAATSNVADHIIVAIRFISISRLWCYVLHAAVTTQKTGDICKIYNLTCNAPVRWAILLACPATVSSAQKSCAHLTTPKALHKCHISRWSCWPRCTPPFIARSHRLLWQ